MLMDRAHFVFALHQVLENYKPRLTPQFQIKLYWGTAVAICLHVTCGQLGATVVTERM